METLSLEEILQKAQKDIREVELEVIKIGFPLEHFDLISKYVRAEIVIAQALARRTQLLTNYDGTAQ